MSRYVALASILTRFAANAPNEPVKLGDAIDMLETQAYPFTATLITLPFLQPFPLGFFALIGSSAYIALGWQLYQNNHTLTLPNKVRDFKVNQTLRQGLVNTCLKIIGLLRKLSKPRLPVLVNGLLGKKISGLILISVGILVAIPLGGVIPFKNLFPSLAVLFYCVSETEQDGLMVIFSVICLILTIIFYSLIFFLLWQFGATAIEQYVWPTN